MDFLNLPTGLALLAVAGAALGVVAWKRSRRAAEPRPAMDATLELPSQTPLPPLVENTPAHHAAAKELIEQARASAAVVLASAPEEPSEAETVPAPLSQFDGPAWAATEPMPGIAIGPEFADTLPAEMNDGPTNFADTLVAEFATEEQAGARPDTLPRPA